MNIIAVDPGTTQSAWLNYCTETRTVCAANIVPNHELLSVLTVLGNPGWHLAIEMVQGMGMSVGQEVFETVWWTGRYCEAWYPKQFTRIYRKDVKLHLCGSPRAKDPNIRQAIIDRFGGKDIAIGNKKQPGPLHGVKSHLWSALAVALYHADTQAVQERINKEQVA